MSKPVTAAQQLKWTILDLGDIKEKLPDPSAIVDALERSGVTMLKTGSTKKLPSRAANASGEEFDNALGKTFEDLKKDGVGLVIVILSSHKAATYSRVKYWADYRHGMLNILTKPGALLTFSRRDSHHPRSVRDLIHEC